MPPGIASRKEQFGFGLKARIVMMYRKSQSTAGRIVEILNDIGLDVSRRSVASGRSAARLPPEVDSAVEKPVESRV